jgi:hypothetical protein
MTQQLLSTEKHDPPALIVPIAILAFAYALTLVVCGGFSFAGLMSMRVGSQVLGSGLETMGPVPYFLYACALGVGASGLMRAKTWGRTLLIVVCAGGVFLLVPHISSAVMDERYLAMSLDGAQILIRVAIASYLWREAEWFQRAT